MFRILLITLSVSVSHLCLAQSKGLIIAPNTSAAYLWLNSESLTNSYFPASSSGNIQLVNKATRGSKMSYGINIGYMFLPNFGLMSGFNVMRHKWKFHAENLIGSPKHIVDHAVSQTFYEFPLNMRFVWMMKKLNVVMNVGVSYLALQKGEDRLTKVVGGITDEKITYEVFGMYSKHNASTFLSLGLSYSVTPFLQIELTPELQMLLFPTVKESSMPHLTTLGGRLSVDVLPFNIKKASTRGSRK